MAATPTRSPVNDPGPVTTANASTSPSAPAVFVQQIEELARQALAVRARLVALACEALVVDAQGDTAARGRRFERQNDHRRNVILRRILDRRRSDTSTFP